ncbi:MAG: sensor histidine kinase [Chthoniobacteraceae bacterium]
MSLREALRRQSRSLVVIESLVLVGLIGWIDYVTGREWSFFVCYALPIVIVVRKTNRGVGFAFALLCAAVWCAAQFGGNPYETKWGFALAAASRLFYFFVLVIAAAALKAQRNLDRARIQTLEHAQELEREILRTSEREQQRIGRDLHDTLGPHLAAIGYAATFLANELRQREQPEAGKADQIREMVSEAVSLTRGLARGLFPVQMDGSGLAMALQDLAAISSRLSGIAVTFFETGDPLVADPQDAMQLYRIVQEAVNNAAKHGDAKNVTIVMSKNENSLSLVIADDGKGITTTQSGTGGVGFHSMKYRARDLGGTLEITSNPGDGTIISCEIPLLRSSPAPAAS